MSYAPNGSNRRRRRRRRRCPLKVGRRFGGMSLPSSGSKNKPDKKSA
jgi:hypothetical protein